MLLSNYGSTLDRHMSQHMPHGLLCQPIFHLVVGSNRVSVRTPPTMNGSELNRSRASNHSEVLGIRGSNRTPWSTRRIRYAVALKPKLLRQSNIGLVSSWIMIWGTSIWRRGCSNHSTTRSAQKCNPCLRYELSPMCPGRPPRGVARPRGRF